MIDGDVRLLKQCDPIAQNESGIIVRTDSGCRPHPLDHYSDSVCVAHGIVGGVTCACAPHDRITRGVELDAQNVRFGVDRTMEGWQGGWAPGARVRTWE